MSKISFILFALFLSSMMYGQNAVDDNRILSGSWEYRLNGTSGAEQVGTITFNYVDGKQTAVLKINMDEYPIDEIKNNYHTYTFNFTYNGRNVIVSFDYGLDTMRGNTISDGWQTPVIFRRLK